MFAKTFENTGHDHSGLDAARAWLRDHGFSYGSLQGPAPVGILRGEYEIAKWRNLTARERRELHGTIEPGPLGFRAGPAIVKLHEAFVPASVQGEVA